MYWYGQRIRMPCWKLNGRYSLIFATPAKLFAGPGSSVGLREYSTALKSGESASPGGESPGSRRFEHSLPYAPDRDACGRWQCPYSRSFEVSEWDRLSLVVWARFSLLHNHMFSTLVLFIAHIRYEWVFRAYQQLVGKYIFDVVLYAHNDVIEIPYTLMVCDLIRWLEMI